MIDGRRNAARLLMVGLVILLVLVALGYRLAGLHLGSSEEARRFAESRRIERTRLGPRATIYDRHGGDSILALDITYKDVVADPKVIVATGEVEYVSSMLASVLDIELEKIRDRIDRPDRRYERLAIRLDEQKAAEIEDMELPGIRFETRIARCYPHKDFMCHAVGFVNDKGIGSGGTEQTMHRFLRGCPGFLETEVDGWRKEVRRKRIQDIEPKPGADVYLTLDRNVQYAVEKALDKVIEEHGTDKAWAIVQRVSTGEILAMASRPSYDLNEFRNSTEEQRLNRAIGANYEPGSTMKIVTIAAALEYGLVTPDTMIFCENGAWRHCSRILRDHSSYGWLSVADVLKKSSNIGTAKMAVMLGDHRLADSLRRAGMGSKTGIDLPGEERGMLSAPDGWSPISASRIGIGQGVAVTSLQMLGAMCAIANDGVLMKPYVVDKVVAADGSITYENKPEKIGRAMKPETAETMKDLLVRVTEQGGTGQRARVPGYKVAGKTGTAQKVVDGVYSDTENVASFVGFLPAENPELGIIVVVDNPQPVHYGGLVAAPAFSEIAASAVRYLNIEPGGAYSTLASAN